MILYVADTQVGTSRAQRNTQKEQMYVSLTEPHLELLQIAAWLPIDISLIDVDVRLLFVMRSLC